MMRWYWKVLGGHTHIRVFMNCGLCGNLCFRNEEFKHVVATVKGVEFIEDGQVTEKPFFLASDDLVELTEGE